MVREKTALSAAVLSLQTDLEASRAEISRLHVRLARLEDRFDHGGWLLDQVHTKLESLSMRVQLLQTQVTALYRGLVDHLTPFLGVLRIYN